MKFLYRAVWKRTRHITRITTEGPNRGYERPLCGQWGQHWTTPLDQIPFVMDTLAEAAKSADGFVATCQRCQTRAANALTRGEA